MAHRGDALYISNLPRFSDEESVVDLFGQSIAWECPVTNVRILKRQDKKQVDAVAWIVTGGENAMSEVTLEDIIENLHQSTFQGKTIDVRIADAADVGEY